MFRERRRVFVAVFIQADNFVLWIDGQEYRLLAPEITARVDDTVPFLARRFRLRKGAETVFDASYRFVQRQAWPDDGDIFSMVCRIVGSADGGRGFLRVWQARGEGRDLGSKEFLAELQSLIDDPEGRDG